MVVQEFKSESTLIRIDDSYIETKENSKEILNILLSQIIRKIS